MNEGTQPSVVVEQSGARQVMVLVRQALDLAALLVMALVGLGISI
jgi:hypothetical protein